jgi:hypothetical protein
MMGQEVYGKAAEGNSLYGLFLKYQAPLPFPHTAVSLHSKQWMAEASTSKSLGRVSSLRIVNMSSFATLNLMVVEAMMLMLDLRF